MGHDGEVRSFCWALTPCTNSLILDSDEEWKNEKWRSLRDSALGRPQNIRMDSLQGRSQDQLKDRPRFRDCRIAV